MDVNRDEASSIFALRYVAPRLISRVPEGRWSWGLGHLWMEKGATKTRPLDFYRFLPRTCLQVYL